MNNIVKRNNGNYSTPLTGFVDTVLKNSLSRFFDDDNWGLNENTGQVPVNIRETGKTYEMELVAPGLRKEDFHIDLNKDLLTISFEHREENKEDRKDEGYLRTEYRMRSFTRSFRVDDTVDINNIIARYQDGILHMTLPKKEGAQKISKSIQVQ
jgi:HSP20 family protein